MESCCPLAVDAISGSNDGIKVEVLDLELDAARAFLANYKEILDS